MTRSAIAQTLGWLAGGAGAVIIYAVDPVSNARAAALVLSVLSLILGTWIFWSHGGGRITAAGVWGFAFALFVGFAGIYDVTRPGGSSPDLVTVLIPVYFCQVLMYGLFWIEGTPHESRSSWPAAPSVARWGVGLGSSVLLVSAVLATMKQEVNGLVDGAAFASAVLVAASLLMRGKGLGLWRLFLATCAFIVYSVFVFKGFGRLTVGALGLAVGILACRRWPRRSFKAGILLFTAPALLIFAQSRVELTTKLNPNQSPSFTGLESVVGPLVEYRDLLARRDEIPLGWGSTFWASAVAITPRAMWPGKPDGFGAVLVPILHPDLVGIGYSTAALTFGEWVFDFGLVGLVLMVPILGWAVRRTDVWLTRVSHRPIQDRSNLLGLVAATIVAAGYADIVWGGTFLFMTRTGFRLLALGVFALEARLTVAARTPSDQRLLSAGDHFDGSMGAGGSTNNRHQSSMHKSERIV
jgi:hypothetical protein